MMMFTSASITGDLTNIIDTHAAGEEGNGKEETNDEDGDCHENPCDGFEAAVAEGLEHTGSQNANNEPPNHTVEITGNKVIYGAGYCDQKNSCGRLTQCYGFHPGLLLWTQVLLGSYLALLR